MSQNKQEKTHSIYLVHIQLHQKGTADPAYSGLLQNDLNHEELHKKMKSEGFLKDDVTLTQIRKFLEIPKVSAVDKNEIDDLPEASYLFTDTEGSSIYDVISKARRVLNAHSMEINQKSADVHVFKITDVRAVHVESAADSEIKKVEGIWS